MPDLCAAVHPEQPVVTCTLPPHKADVHWSETFGFGWDCRPKPLRPGHTPRELVSAEITPNRPTGKLLGVEDFDPPSTVDSAPQGAPSGVFRITVTVPNRDDIDHDGLFTAVADAVHGWEPAERDGWDAWVSAGVDDPNLSDVAAPSSSKLDQNLQQPSDVDGELRDKLAAAIAEADGREVDLEPLADASYPEMADVALSVVRPLLDAKDAKISRWKERAEAETGAANAEFQAAQRARAERDGWKNTANEWRRQLIEAGDTVRDLMAQSKEADAERASLSAFRARAAHAALCLDEQEDDEIIAEIDTLSEERHQYRQRFESAWEWMIDAQAEAEALSGEGVEADPRKPRVWLDGDDEPTGELNWPTVADKFGHRWMAGELPDGYEGWFCPEIGADQFGRGMWLDWDDLLTKRGPLTEALAPSTQDGE